MPFEIVYQTVAHLGEHEWYGKHENRKLLLHNLPVEYRYAVTGYAYQRNRIYYPSDWANLVDHLMTERVTLFLVHVLHLTHAQYPVGSTEALLVWREQLRDWVGNFRGSYQKLINMVSETISVAERTEIWSKRIRAQKAALAHIKANKYGTPGYRTLENNATNPRQMEALYRPANERDKTLDTIVQVAKRDLPNWRTQLFDADNGFPQQPVRLSPDGRPTPRLPRARGGYYFREQISLKDGRMILLPNEFTVQDLAVLHAGFLGLGTEGLGPTWEIEITQPKDEPTIGAQVAWASVLPLGDVRATIDEAWPSWKPLGARELSEDVEAGVRTWAQLAKQYPVPESWSDYDAVSEGAATVEP